MPSDSRHATLYRMVMDKHVCPWGLKARWLLRRGGYAIDDHWLRTRADTDAFQAEHGVKTTPQVFIDGRRIGGYDDLRRYLDKPVRDPDATTYRPVLTLFAMALAMAVAVVWVPTGGLAPLALLRSWGALAMCLLAVQKLQDVDSFATMFLGYDLLARRWVPYAYVYPFAEALAGILMLAGVGGPWRWMGSTVAMLIGGVGAVSVVYAVYVQKRELRCACVGGNSQVPLGAISLTENLMMVAMGAWMLSG